MKKLLKLHLKSAQILEETEMKTVFGGFEVTSGTCAVYLPYTNGNRPGMGNFDGQSGTYSSGALIVDSEAGYTIHKGISYESAMAMIAGIEGAKWCCDNCDSASWL